LLQESLRSSQVIVHLISLLVNSLDLIPLSLKFFQCGNTHFFGFRNFISDVVQGILSLILYAAGIFQHVGSGSSRIFFFVTPTASSTHE